MWSQLVLWNPRLHLARSRWLHWGQQQLNLVQLLPLLLLLIIVRLKRAKCRPTTRYANSRYSSSTWKSIQQNMICFYSILNHCLVLYRILRGERLVCQPIRLNRLSVLQISRPLWQLITITEEKLRKDSRLKGIQVLNLPRPTWDKWYANLLTNISANSFENFVLTHQIRIFGDVLSDYVINIHVVLIYRNGTLSSL